MTFPLYPHYPNQVPSLDETIWANADEETSDWETYATAASTNTYVAVNSAGTSDWVWLHNNRVIFAEAEGTRLLRYDMQSPSGEVNPYQTVDLTVRCRRYDSAGADPPASATVTINFFEDNSQVTDGGGTAQQVNNTAASYYTHRLSAEAVASVSDWDDVEISCTFAASGIDTSPPEHYVTFRVYEVKIVFS
jgi:hypothetical protein